MGKQEGGSSWKGKLFFPSLIIGLGLWLGNQGNATQHFDRLLGVMGKGMSDGESATEFRKKYEGLSGNEQHKHSDASIARSFYNLATEFYEYGWGDSFHFGFRLRHEGHNIATDNSQTFIATKLSVGNMDKVLDMGCGIGGPLRGVVKRTGANVTGVTINEFQVRRAKEITAGLTPWMQERSHFVVQDYLTMEDFTSNTYDAVYYMESSLHCENRTKTFEQAFRLLKPGGRLVALEYVTLDKWDPANPEMAELMTLHLRGNGAATTPTAAQAVGMVQKAGFEVREHFDYMAHGDEIYGDRVWPWWQDLQMNYRLHLPAAHPWVRGAQPYILSALAAIGLVPEEVPKTATLLNEGADGLSGLGMLGAITPQYYILGVKPHA